MSLPVVEFIGPGEGLIAAVASRLRPSGRDYSGAWVVFPEKRPAYYLLKFLAEREGAGFIPPRLDSLDTFIDRIYAERLGLAGRPIDVLDAVALLFELHRGAKDRPGGDVFLEADEFFPLGVKLYRDLEELAAAGTVQEDLLRLDTFAEETIPGEMRERLQRLSFFYEKFYDRLSALGLTSAGSRLRAVATGLAPGLFPDIEAFFFAGFFSLAKVEAAVVRAILSWEGSRLLLLKGRGLEGVLDALGVPDPAIRAEASAPDSDPCPPVTFTKSPDTHGEIAALNAVLADKLADPSRLDEGQVIVLPASETLFPLTQQTLASLAEEDYNVSLGYPLGRTPLASFFERLLEVVQSMDEGRVYVPHYLRFVLHPYTKNIHFPGRERRADLTRILVHAVEEELVRRRTKVFWRLEEVEADEGIRKTIQFRSEGVEGAPAPAAFLDHLRAIHAATIAPFLAIRDVGDFAAKLARVLDHIYEKSTARPHRFFHPYAEAFMAQLEGMARSLLRTVVFREAASYAQLFRKVVAAGRVPFYGTPLRGLQVLGFWETRGIPFEEIYVLDLNEEVMPAFGRADSTLPFGVRRALGLPTHRDEELRMEYYLDTLIRGAKAVHLFFVENNDRERSRFVERLLWEAQRRDGEKDAGRYVRTVEYRVDLATAGPSAVAKTAAMAEFLREFRYSATALDIYLSCPLRFCYAYILGLREKEEVAERTEKKDIGVFVHGVLEEYFRPFRDRRLSAADLREGDLASLAERRFAEVFGGDASGAAYLMKLQTLRHLGDFLTLYQKPILKALASERKALRIIGLEREVAGERAGLKLKARIDRTEMRGEEIYVLDYKTSHDVRTLGIDFGRLDLGARRGWSQWVRSLQIPLYTLLLAQELGVPSEKVRGRFVMLGRNRLSPEAEFSPYEARKKGAPADPSERRDRIATVERLIEMLLAEIADPAKPFEPAAEDSGACRFCPYPDLCGR
jgi:RecB family exonuclease